MPNYLLILAGSLLVAACGTQPIAPSAGHIRDEPRPAGHIPQPVRQTVLLPPPRATAKTETYSVVVNDVPVRELLFALARDAGVNVDVHPGIPRQGEQQLAHRHVVDDHAIGFGLGGRPGGREQHCLPDRLRDVARRAGFIPDVAGRGRNRLRTASGDKKAAGKDQ